MQPRSDLPVLRVLVTGSRTWQRPQVITAALTELHAEHGQRLTVVHGACPHGADAIADAWCVRQGVPVERHPADWALDGKAAGRTRNAVMVTDGADLCLAFIRNHSPGASHCADLAQQAGIHTIRHEQHDQQPTTAPRADPQALLCNAIEHAERGWHIFPIRPGDKRPAFPDHDAEHCTDRDPRCRTAGKHVTWEVRATTDPARIRAAWSRTPFNVGVACGPSDLVVVDLDMPEPGEETPPEAWNIEGVHDGRDTFAVLCERAGAGWPATYTVTTGRGGMHLYFRHPPGVKLRNTQGKHGGLGWLVDTRAHGGYVVAAGSVVDGRAYTAWDTDPAPLPGWLAQALTPRPLPPQQPVRVDLGTGRRAAYVQAAVRHQVDLVRGAQPGARNQALYLSAVALGQLVAGGELDALDVTDLLTDATLAAGLRGGPREAAATIASGLRAGASRPRSVAA